MVLKEQVSVVTEVSLNDAVVVVEGVLVLVMVFMV